MPVVPRVGAEGLPLGQLRFDVILGADLQAC